MKLTPIISLGLSAILGLLALAIGQGWFSGGSDASTAEAAETAPTLAAVETVTVVVAAEDIEMAAQLQRGMLTVTEWPARLVPEGAFSALTELPLSRNFAPYASGFIARGEPILPGKLVQQPPRRVLSESIPDGMRAVSVSVTLESGVSGFVLPGDRVDITAYTRIEGRTGPDAWRATPLLKGVLVLAADQTFTELVEGALPAQTVTVAVTPADALRLSAAARDSRLGLALLGREEAEKLEAAAGRANASAPAPPRVKPQVTRRPTATTRRAVPRRPSKVAVTVVHGVDAETVTAPVDKTETDK